MTNYILIWWNPALAPAGFALQIRQNPALVGFPKSKSGTALVTFTHTSIVDLSPELDRPIYVYSLCDWFVDYLEKLHRRGNKLILVHAVELPELSLHNASKSLFVKIYFMYYWRISCLLWNWDSLGMDDISVL